MTDYDDEEPLAAWEAAFLPDWEWEAYEKEDDGIYFGRVKSPNTYGRWEYGTFSQDQLETAGAYRTDTGLDEDAELFPDGGHPIPEDDGEVWFWYNPSADMIVQDEAGAYNVTGLFATEEDADQFLHSYAEKYGVDDTSHLEKYRATLSLEGQGTVFEDIDPDQDRLDDSFGDPLDSQNAISDLTDPDE
jgi:hypothetical protein